ncbi:MAG: protein kinase [Fuerstiella sp.]
MVETNISEFINNLETSQLLSAAQIASLKKQTAGSNINVENLANVLVSQNHLTNWQARQLMKGQTGFLLNQYRLTNPIGRGGMGHVFRGVNSRTNDVVAVKVMAKKLLGNKALVSRFRREIRANAKLNSPHVVRSLDAGRVGKTDFMVMEYVNGDQVDRMVSRIGRLPVGLACEIVRQVAVGLQHAHEHQMVHRDIKPGNMMVHWSAADEGIVKLMDMGLVLLNEDDADEKTVTRAGQVMGTPDYMSPEQGWDTTQVDIRSDIYSLGCTLYRLLSGTVPFMGTNPLQVLSQRLQRDAPSIRTVCDDIPQPVADIVSKMTARAPNARYQQPHELASALLPFCETLTKAAVKSAALKNGAGASVVQEDSNSNEIDESDGTYQQFLKEIQEGSHVDLMNSTENGDDAGVSTIPNLKVHDSSPAIRNREYSSGPKRGQKTAFVVMGVMGIVIAALAMFLINHTDTPVEPLTINHQPPKLKIPTATINDTEFVSARTGELWTHKLEADISDTNTNARFILGNSAPLEMQIDAATGEITWPVPSQQTLTSYTIPVQLVCDVDGNEHVIAEKTFSVAVVKGFDTLQFPELELVIAPPEEPIQLSVAVDSADGESFDLSYKFESRVPATMTIDAKTGLIQWTPTVSDLGRHSLDVAVYDTANPASKKSTKIPFVVVPSRIEHVLPAIPPQKAIAGTLFEFSFPELPLPRMSRGSRMGLDLVITLGPDAPVGATIDAVSQKLSWNIPADIRGLVKIPLTASFELGPLNRVRKMDGVAILEIDVTEPTTTPTVTLPSEAEIAKAREKLQETYSKSIAQARTTTDKAELANRLLEQSFYADHSATDAALLQLIEQEIAIKARAGDVLLEIGRIRAARYGTSELDAAVKIVDEFRKTGLSQRQQDLITEHCMRLAKLAAADKRIGLTEDLLHCVTTLLGRSSQGAAAQFANDVNSAEKIAIELNKATDGVVDEFKLNELNRLIDRWQFQRLFMPASSFVYAQLTSDTTVPVLPGNGRDRWKFDKERLSLNSETEPLILAVVDRTLLSDRFVFRFEVEQGTTSTQLLFGATGANNSFSAYRLTLDASGPGQIQALNSSQFLTDPARITAPSVYPDQRNLVELVVDGPTVAVRINGAMVSQANIPELPPGQLGIAADLRSANPKLFIRNPRVLQMPKRE